MNISELRSTMVEHAESLQDSPQARVVAVRRRVHVVRRRRRAALAVSVAAAVAAVGVVVIPPAMRHHDDVPPAQAPSRLAGREVPRTQTATGFTYRYVQGQQSRPGRRSLDVEVQLTDTPQLVMWASSDTTSTPGVRLANRSTTDQDEVSRAGGFSRYLWLPTRDSGLRVERLRLTQRDADSRTRLALAVYSLAGMPGDAVTDGEVAYRSQVAGESRVAARIGRRGETDLGFDVRIPARDVSLAPTCYGTTARWTLTAGGREVMSGRCSRDPEVDAGASPQDFDGGPFPDSVRAGDTVRVRMRLVGAGDDSTAVLGVGLYTDQGRRQLVAGHRLPEIIEDSGHEWRLFDSGQSTADLRTIHTSVDPTTQPQLVSFAETGSAQTKTVTVRVTSNGRRHHLVSRFQSAGGSGSSAPVYVVQPGEKAVVSIEVTQGRTPASRLGLVVYRLVH